jgi:hypothetical protein
MAFSVHPLHGDGVRTRCLAFLNERDSEQHEDAGFAKPADERFVDADGFHRLLCFAT